MAYNANIPQASDQISVSQAQLLANFQEINTYTAVDHEAFGLVDAGKHKKATFPVHAAPGAVGATEVGLYAANSGGTPELWINKTASQVPFTKSSQAATGYTYLPSGIIMQWGTALLSNAGVAVNFPLAFPVTCLNVQLTNHSDASTNQFLMANNLGAASFIGWATTRSGGAVANVPVYWFAIGY